MKLSKIFISGCFIFLSLSFQTKPEEEGIIFFKGSWDEVLEESKKENKLIFLDIYASWCGVCRVLKTKTFADPEAGKFFNKHFINYAIDGEKGEGKEIFAKYVKKENEDTRVIVKGFPRLLIIDKDGQLVHSTSGFHSSEELIKLGKDVLDNNKDQK